MNAGSLFKRAVLTVLVGVLATAVALAQNTPTVRFVNYSGEDATVKLVGPTAGYIEVPNGASLTVGIRGGSYTIVTRHGKPGNYSYQRGEQLFVSETPYGVDRISITLHKVQNGNYHTQKVRSSDF